MDEGVGHSRSLIGFIGILALAHALIGCESGRAVATAATPQVENLLHQALAEQIATGREVIVNSVKSPPHMIGEWHWHPSETFSVTIRAAAAGQLVQGNPAYGTLVQESVTPMHATEQMK